MSGNRRGGPPFREPYERRKSYDDSPSSFQNRESRRMRDPDQDWEFHRSDEQSRGRGRGRGRSRSPSGRYESYHPRYEPARINDSRAEQSSSASSIAGSPHHSSRVTTLHEPSKSRPATNLDTVIEATEAPAPRAYPTLEPVDHSAALMDLITVVQMLTQKSSNTSALKFQLDNAKKVLEEREAEFTKSASQHLKFPNTKAYQSEAKILAEEKCKAIGDALAEETNTVNTLATEAIQKLVPQVAFMSISKKEQELIEQNDKILGRCNSLERSLRDLTETVKTQTKYIEDFQNSRKELKDNQAGIEIDVQRQLREANLNISTSKNDIKSLKSQLTDASQNISLLSKDNLSLKLDLAAAKETITQMGSKSAELSGLKIDFAKLKMEHDIKVNGVIGMARGNSNLIQQNVESLVTLKKNIEIENAATKAGLGSLKDSLDRIQLVSATPKIPAALPPPPQQVSFSNDILSSSINRITSTEKRLEIFEHKISVLERVQESSKSLTGGLGEMLEACQNFGKDVENRVAKVEEVQKNTKGFKNEFEKAFKADLKVIEKRLDHMQEEVQRSFKDDLKVVEHRLDRIENVRKSPARTPQASPVPPNQSVTIPPDLILQLQQLESDIALCKHDVGTMKAGQDSLLRSFTNTVDENVNKAIDDEIEPRLRLIEETLATLKTLSELPAHFQKLEESQKQSASNQRTEMAETKRNLEAAVTSKVLELIRADPSIISQAQFNDRFNSLHTAFKSSLDSMSKELANNSNLNDSKILSLSNEVDALANASNNHEARMNNINTGSLVNYMLDQLGERFPSLQVCQQLRTELDNQKRVLQTHESSIETSRIVQEDLVSRLRGVSTSSAQVTQAITGMEKATAANIDHLKGKVTVIDRRFEVLMQREIKIGERFDGVNRELAVIRGNQPSDALKALFETYNQQLSALKEKHTSMDNEIEGQVKIIKDQLKAIQEQLKTLQASQLSDIRAQISTINEKLPTIEEQLQTRAENQDKLSTTIEEQIAIVKAQLEGIQTNQLKIPDVENQITKIREQVDTMKDNQRNTNQEKIPAIEIQVANISEQLHAIKDTIQKTFWSPSPAVVPPRAQNEVNGSNSSRFDSAASQIPNPAPPSDVARNRNASRNAEGRNRKESPVRSDLTLTTNRKRKQASGGSGPALKAASKNVNASIANKKAKTRQAFVQDDDSDEASNFATPKYGGATNDEYL